MTAKTLKNPYRLQTVAFKLSLKVNKTKIREEKLKVTYSVALEMAFHVAENEKIFYGPILAVYLLSVRTN